MSNTLKFGNGQWATKVGSTLAYNDENGNFKPLPFDFTRASSATVVDKDGLIKIVGSGEPRIDFSNDSNGALLLEPSRTNLALYSEDISNSVWANLASGETILANSVISPDGNQNADTLEGNGTTTNVYIRQDVTLTTSTDYTFSIFAKKGTNDFLAVAAEGFDGATNTLLIFDLNNRIVTTGTGDIEDYGNGWLRCSFTIAISTDGTGRFLVYPSYNGTTRGFPTSSDANGQNIYLWGAQLEAGSYATSYIPTQGAISTRVGEVCSDAGNDQVINSTEGVLFAEISALVDDNTVRMIQISDGTNGNRVIIYYKNGGTINGALASGGSTVVDIPFSATFTNTNKVAIRYKLNDVSLWINGVKVGEDLSANSPIGLDRLSFNQDSGANYFYGNTKDLRVYNTALTDQELINLTTI